MADIKAATAKGAKILPDLTAKAPAAPQVASTEKVAVKKKNANITTTYIDKDGKDVKSPDQATALRVLVPGQIDEMIVFADLKPAIATAALAFGLNTVYRNTFNSTYNTAGSMSDAVDALVSRHEGFERGEWRTEGEGGEAAIPLIIEAIRRAYLDNGKTADDAEAQYNACLTKYRALETKEAKAAQLKLWGARGKVQIAYDTIKAERAAARLAKSKAALAAKGGEDDLSDL
jgi:hypothetical protein